MKLLSLLILISLFMASGCNKQGSTSLADGSYGLVVQKLSGDNQEVPIAYYSDPLVVEVKSIDGLSADGMEVVYEEISGTSATVMNPKVVVTNGKAATRVISPNSYNTTFSIRATVKGTQVSQVFNLTTIEQSATLKFELVTTNLNVEKAGEDFNLNLYIRDEQNNLINYNEAVSLYINVATKPSWTGKTSTGIPSPTVPVICIFVAGYCKVPTTFNIKDAREATLIWIGDGPGGIEDAAAQPIIIENNIGSHLALTNALGGPNLGAKGFNKITLTADDPSQKFFTAIIDKAGNYIQDTADINISSSIPQIFPYMNVNSNLGTLDFTPTKKTSGPLSLIKLAKSGYYDSFVEVTVNSGVPSKLLPVINGGVTPNVGDVLNVKVYITDRHDNITEKITDSVNLSVNALEGRRPNGFPDLSLVNADLTLFPNISGSTTRNLVTNNDLILNDYSVFFFQGESFTPALISLRFNNRFSNPSLRFTTTKTTFLSSIPGEDPVVVSSPPSSTNYDISGNVINKINFNPYPVKLKPAYIILRNPSSKVPYCSLANSVQYKAGAAPNPVPNTITDVYHGACETFFMNSDSAPVNLQAYFVDANGNDIDADPSTPARDPINITWTARGAFDGGLSATTGNTITFAPINQGTGALQMTATVPNNSYFENAGSTITTHILGQVSTGDVHSFEMSLTALPTSDNTYGVKFRALDRSGVWVRSYSKSVPVALSYTGATASPRGTNPVLPVPTTLNFINGEAFLNGIRTPKAGQSITLDYSITETTKTITGSYSWTSFLGNLNSIGLNTGYNGQGTDWSNLSFTVEMNDIRDYTIFPTSYDFERNIISPSVPCTWTTQNVFTENYTTSLKVGLYQTTTSARITCTFGGVSASTGFITIKHGPLSDIGFTQVQLPPYVAGESIKFKLRLMDNWYNTITDPAQGANSTRTVNFYGNNNTSGGTSQATFPSGTITFTDGVSPELTLRIGRAGVNSIGFVDQGNANFSDSELFNVNANTPYKLTIDGMVNFEAGYTSSLMVRLRDQYENIITTGPGSNQKISISLTALGDLDITGVGGLTGAASVAGANDLSVTGYLNAGSSSITFTGTRAGNFTVTAKSEPDAGNVSLPTNDPLSRTFKVEPTNPNSLAWVSTSGPLSSYPVNNASWTTFRAELLDIYNNVCTNITAPNSITLTAAGAAQGLSGTTTVSPIAGVASFADINYLLAGDSFNLTATYSNGPIVLSVSQPVTTSVGPVRNILLMFNETKLVPGSATLNAALGGDRIDTDNIIEAGATVSVKAIATDAGFNKVSSYTGQVTLKASDDPNVTISPSTLTSLVAGERSFTVTHKKVSTGAYLFTTCTVDNCTNSAAYDVTTSHTIPNRLAVLLPGQTLNQGVTSTATSCISGAGSAKTAGVPFTVNVQATDAYCNPMTNSTSQVTLSSLGDAAAPTVTPLNMVNGAQTFTFENRTSGSSMGVRATLSPSTGYTSSAYDSTSYTVNSNNPVAVNSSFTVTSNIIANDSATALVTITLKDDYNNPVPSRTPVISISGSGNNIVQACTSTNASGVSTCTFKSTKAESKLVSVTSPVTLSAQTSTFIAGPAAVATSSIVGAGPVTANGSNVSSITITLFDAFNNPVIGTVPTFNASGTSNTYAACSASDASGVSTCTMSSTKAESKTPSILTPIVKTGSAISFVHGPATKVAYVSNPSITNIAGENFTNQPVIQVLDFYNNRVTDTGIDANATASITLSSHVGSCAGSATSTSLSGTTTINASSGLATYAGINHSKAETIYIKASSGTLATACSPAVLINPNAPVAEKSSFAMISNNAIADNTATNTVRVTLVDTHNNPVSGTTPTLTISGSANAYTCTSSNSSGVSDCTIRTTKAETKTVSIATPSALSTLASINLTFVPGAATKLAFSTQPSTSVTAGVALSTQPVVQVLDVNNNIVTSSSASITLAAYTNSGCTTTSTATLQGTTTLAAGSGVASFSGINHTKAENLYIRAFTTGLATACSSAATVVIHAAPNSIAFTQEPSVTATAGVTLATQPRVTIYDVFNNIATSVSGSVTFSAVTSANCSVAASATLQGTTTFAFSSGVATASGLNYQKAEAIKIAASHSSFTACSNTVNVSSNTVADATTTISTIVNNSVADNAATNSVRITLLDAYSNPKSGVTPAIGSTGSANTMSCGVSDANGVADCTIRTTKAENKTINITSPSGLTSKTTNVTFVPGTATKLVFSTQPSNTVTAGVNLAVQPVVQIQDVNNNIVTSSTDSISLGAFTDSGCSVASTATLQGSTSLNATSGVASFTGINHTKAETLYIKATAGTLIAPCSNLVTVSAANAVAGNSSISVTTNNSAADGTATNVVRVTLKDTYNNPKTGVTPTVSVTGSANTVACGATNASGQSDCTIKTTKAETKSLSVTAPVTLGPVSITFVPGAASKIVFTTQPSAAVVAGVTLATQPVAQIQDFYGNPINTTDTITLSASTNSGCSAASTATLQGTTSVAAVAGTATFSGVNHTKAEALYIKATSGGLTAACSTLVNVSHAAADHLAFTQQPSASATAGVVFAVQPKVTIYDAFNNVATSVSGSVTLSAVTSANCAVAASDTLKGSVSLAFSSGVASATTASFNKSENIKINATHGALSVCSNTVNVSPGVASAVTSSVNTDGSAVADGTDTVTVTVTLRDSNFNTINGQALTYSVTPNTNVTALPCNDTGANGEYNCLVSSTVAGSKSFDLSLPISKSTTLTFTPGSANETNSTLTASPTMLVANGTSNTTVTVTLKDANNNVISGQTVALTITPATGASTPSCSTTNASGVATCTFNSTVAEVKRATLTTPNFATKFADITFTPGAAHNTYSSISAAPATILADGTQTSTISIHLGDVNNNNISGITPALSGLNGSDVVTCGTTAADGNTTCSFKTTVSGTRTIGFTTPSGVTKTVTINVNPNQADLARNDATTTSFVSSTICGSSDSQTYSFINNGFINTGALSISVTDDADWDLGADTCTGADLSPGQNCSVTIVFNCGQVATSATNTLTVSGSATGASETLSLTGSR